MSFFSNLFGTNRKVQIANGKASLPRPDRRVGTGENLPEGHLPAGQGYYIAAPYAHPGTGNLVRIPQGWLNPPYTIFGSKVLGKAQSGGNSGFTFRVQQPLMQSGYKLPNQAVSNGAVFAGVQKLQQGLGQMTSDDNGLGQ